VKPKGRGKHTKGREQKTVFFGIAGKVVKIGVNQIRKTEKKSGQRKDIPNKHVAT